MQTLRFQGVPPFCKKKTKMSDVQQLCPEKKDANATLASA
jgi:hypothetical protein